MNYFLHDEKLTCNCGECRGLQGIDKKLEDKLNVARHLAGIPFYINSGFRCEKHPDSIKNPNSAHTRGNAVDIKTTTSRGRFLIIKSLLEAGFTRIGVGDGFVHADIDDILDKKVIWRY